MTGGRYRVKKLSPPPVDIYLSRNGETYGPYSQAELRGHLASGSVVPHDHAWCEGESEWQPLELLLKKTSSGVASGSVSQQRPADVVDQSVNPAVTSKVVVKNIHTTEWISEPESEKKPEKPEKPEKLEMPVMEQSSSADSGEADPASTTSQQQGPLIDSSAGHQEIPEEGGALTSQVTVTPAAPEALEAPAAGVVNPVKPHDGVSRPPGQSGLKKLLLLPLFLLLLYLLAPLVSLVLLDRALGRGDGPQIERWVDFGSLKEGLDRDVEARAGGPSPIDPVIAQRIAERFFNPSGLSSLLARPDLALREQSSGTFASMTPQPLDLSSIKGGAITGLDSFVLNLGVLKLTFHLTGWGWRLVRITLPS